MPEPGWEQGKMYWSQQLQLQVNGTNGSDARDELKYLPAQHAVPLDFG